MEPERLQLPEIRKLLEKSYGSSVQDIVLAACEELKIDVKEVSMTIDEYGKLSNYLKDENTRSRLHKKATR